VDIEVLPVPDWDVIARGSYLGGPDYEFVIADDGQVYFRVVGDADLVWAGPNAEVFRRIVEAWNRYQAEVVRLPSEEAQEARVRQLRWELAQLGALPAKDGSSSASTFCKPWLMLPVENSA
jgi:hypothetical protein